MLVEPRLNRPARGVQVNQRLRPPEFRFEFSVKAAGKGKPKVLAFEFEEGDADLILEYVDEARRK